MQVRAAMPGMPVSEQNCHPFQWSRYMWMHNGMVRSFRSLMSPLKATSTPMHEVEVLCPDAGVRNLLEIAMRGESTCRISGFTKVRRVLLVVSD